VVVGVSCSVVGPKRYERWGVSVCSSYRHLYSVAQKLDWVYCGEPLAISRKKSIQVVVRTLPREDTVHPVLNMAMSKSSKMLHYVNYRMRVTIQDSRTLVGTFMAFDKVENVESLHII
jgi:phage terminase large subunit